MAGLRQAERDGLRGAHRHIADRPRVSLHPARDVDGEHGLSRRIDELHRLPHDGAQRAAEARAEDAVEHAVGEAQREAQPVHVAVARESVDRDAHHRQCLLHDGRRCLDVVRIARQEDLEDGAFIVEIARRRESVAAIVAAAGQNTDGLAAHGTEQRDHGRRRLPAGILHQHDLRQAVLLSGAPIDGAHLLDQRYLHRHPSNTHCAVA